MSDENRTAMLQAAVSALSEAAKNPEATLPAIEGTLPILAKEVEMQKAAMPSKVWRWVRHLRGVVIHVVVGVFAG